MIAKYLIQLRQSKLCRKGCCQPPYDVTPLETAMPLGVKGRRSYPLLRLGSYKPMAFWPWVVDVWSSFLSILASAVSGIFDTASLTGGLLSLSNNIIPCRWMVNQGVSVPKPQQKPPFCAYGPLFDRYGAFLPTKKSSFETIVSKLLHAGRISDITPYPWRRGPPW